LDGGEALKASAEAMMDDPDEAVRTWAPNISRGVRNIGAFVQKWTMIDQ
jgi:hypothetical protein